MGIIQYHLFISGQVQGVGYRISSRNVADNLGLTGWVRNCMDDRVEIIAEGDADKLTQFVTWAEQGPSYATVKQVIVEHHTATGEFDSFFIR